MTCIMGVLALRIGFEKDSHHCIISSLGVPSISSSLGPQQYQTRVTIPISSVDQNKQEDNKGGKGNGWR